MPSTAHTFDQSESTTLHFVRICATLSIFLCHACGYMGSWLAQFFNVGVQMFFMLSGFLYAGRYIRQPWKWWGKRLKKLLIPLDVFMLLILIAHLISGAAEPAWAWIINMLPIKGWWGPEISGCGHLWFIAHIFVCYMLTPLLGRIRFRSCAMNRAIPWILTGVLAVLQVIILLPGMFNLHQLLASLFSFCLGYYLLPLCFKKEHALPWFLSLVAVSVAVRLLSLHYFDNTVWYSLSNSYSYPALGFGLVCILHYIGKKVFNGHSVRMAGIIKVISEHTYEFYLVHYVFLSGIYSIRLTEYTYVNIALAFLFSCVSACLLHLITVLFRPVGKPIK